MTSLNNQISQLTQVILTAPAGVVFVDFMLLTRLFYLQVSMGKVKPETRKLGSAAEQKATVRKK
jgi:hypothetical protein